MKFKGASPAIIIGGVLLIIVAAAAAILLNKAQPTTPLYLGSGVFDATIAYTQPARERGYGGVSVIPKNGALILAFATSDTWQITMKDMNVPLDIIWLSSEKKVVHIEKNVSPDGGAATILTPDKPARYVVEVPAGTVKAKVIAIGRSALFDIKTVDIQ
ncbi:hypothetical protein BH10PAT4_BH10PAT4_5070 [soil metagenome]